MAGAGGAAAATSAGAVVAAAGGALSDLTAVDMMMNGRERK